MYVNSTDPSVDYKGYSLITLVVVAVVCVAVMFFLFLCRGCSPIVSPSPYGND